MPRNTTPPARRPAPTSGTAGRAASARTEGMGICHAYAPDGRCISLLKVLLTNFCVFDCAYCINRAGSNVQRARFTVEEVVRPDAATSTGATTSRACSSPPASSARPTTRWSRSSRSRGRCGRMHGFRGYIHLKTIPDAAPELLAAGRPLCRPALDQHRAAGGRKPEGAGAGEGRRAASAAPWRACGCGSTRRRRRSAPSAAPPPRFAPAGQSTQMIVGADAARRPRRCWRPAANLYGSYGLRRVYYSAFQPDPRCVAAAAAGGAAAGARAPAVSGRLADALLRLRAGRDHARAATAACSTSTSIPSWPGR